VRSRWLSPRALVLHLAVLAVAPGCGLAGWWQATRALSGNTLSWAYSVEWPFFGLIAIAGWWQLLHEGPEQYQARKRRSPEDEALLEVERTAAASLRASAKREPGFGAKTARLSAVLTLLVSCQVVLGFLTAVAVPFNRPSGWLPNKGEAFYAAHALVGALVAALAVFFVAWTRPAPRPSKASAWTGLVGLGIAGTGGLLTYLPSLARFSGMAVMFAGAAIAGFAYALPVLAARARRVGVPPGEPTPESTTSWRPIAPPGSRSSSHGNGRTRATRCQSTPRCGARQALRRLFAPWAIPTRARGRF
jgi:hypothetical protein